MSVATETRLDAAIEAATTRLLELQHADGYWVGELESNVTMTAQHLFWHHVLGLRTPELDRKIANELLARQRDDGTWSIWFDRVLLGSPLAALLGSDAHWVFDRGALTGSPPERGQYLTVVSSGAPELMALRGRELVEQIASELTRRLGPAELLWSRVSREPNATIAVRPGSEARRPGPETARPSVVRAGAWTATGWPATMEGAIRSGLAAVRPLAPTRKEVAA